MTAPTPSGRGALGARRHGLALALVWAACALYLFREAGRDWIPPDEGAIAQSGERVLAGELPHRDFDGVWTGLLPVLHALGFRLLGMDLYALRVVLLSFGLLFVPAVYAIAARGVGPLAAAGVTLLCVAWSLPNYFSGVASWYNLFFAVFALFALVRHLASGASVWLVVAGAFAGTAFLFKNTALYFVAAAGLYLLFREQTLSQREAPVGAGRGVGLAVVAGVLVFEGALLLLLARELTPANVIHFALPGTLLCTVLLRNEWKLRDRAAAARLGRLTRLVLPFASGLAAPLALFALPYALSGSLGDLYHGVFVAPRMRLDHVALPLPPAASLWTAAPLALALLLGFRRYVWRHENWLALPVALLLAFVLARGREPSVYDAVWSSVRAAAPLAVAASAVLLLRSGDRARLGSRGRQLLFLLTAAAALVPLIQFPYSAGVYFCYAAPIVVLALHRVIQSQAAAPRAVHVCLLVFYAAFAIVWNHPASTFLLGFRHRTAPHDTLLDVPRGGIRVEREEADLYRRLVAEIQRHSDDGAYIYATPDSPEVYFLAARRNPTRTFYDLFDPDYDDPGARSERILRTLEEKHVDVVVLRRRSESSQLPSDLARELARRYPDRKDLPVFTVLSR